MDLLNLEIRKILAPFATRKIILPLIIFSVDVMVFISLFTIILFTNIVFIKFALSVLLGLVTGLLFVVSHDCCHNSFTANRKLNKFLGVIGFCPALHNFGLWEIGHNQIHHAYTNLKTKDYVYTPLSRTEYNSLSAFKKWQYRLYRGVLGHLFYYGIEIWLKKMTNPEPYKTTKHKKNKYIKYQVPIVVYLVLVISLNYFFSNSWSVFLTNSFFTIMLPFLIWNWIMGFVIYQHHTSPQVKWYKDENEWAYWESQLENSIHIKFPRIINLLLHNIMEHSAHHSNVLIPMYNLNAAQNALEKRFTGRIIVIEWTVRFYLDSIKCCKLYDYENHRWEKF